MEGLKRKKRKLDGSGSSSSSSNASGHHHHHHAHSYESKLNYLMQKILMYSHKSKTVSNQGELLNANNTGSNRNVTSKYAKYLDQLRSHTYVSSSSSGSGDYVEVKLRKTGVLEAMMLVVRNVVDSFKPEQNDGADDDDVQLEDPELGDPKETAERVSILSNSLSVLSNCFARDPVAREDAFKCSVPLTMNKILKLKHQNQRACINPEIQAKALKCVGNLATEKQCRIQILSRGLAKTILNTIRIINKNHCTAAIVTVTPEHALHLETEAIKPLLHNAVRAIRILCADAESRTMLWRMNALVDVGKLLAWNNTTPSDDDDSHSFIVEIMKALNVLSVRFRIAPTEALFELKTQGEPILQRLVNTLKHSKDTKILSLATHSLTNLASIKDIVPRLMNMKIYDVLFLRLAEEDEISVLDDLVRLLQALVMDDSVFCKYLLPYSPKIFATIKVLRLAALEKYHQFILTLFQNLLGGGLETLVENGLVDLLEELLQTIYQTCTFESFRRRISNLDEMVCPVHTEGSCVYTPLYRSTSPTYLEVQEEVRNMLQTRAFLDQAGISTPKRSGSTSGSPPHSWSSSSGFVSDGCSEMYSPSSSGRTSPVSSIESDDESITTATCEEMLFAEYRTDFSDIEMEEKEDEMEEQIQQPEFPEEPAVEAEASTTSKIPSKKRKIEYESECQAKTEKMVLIIDILKNITFLKPFRSSLLRFTPTFMNILCDGKMNCIQYEAQEHPDTERNATVILNKQLFHGSHRMLQEFFADIHNYGFVIEHNLIPLLHRLILLGHGRGHDDDVNSAKNNELQKCNDLLKNLLVVLTGETNQTIGWRAGFMNQNLISGSTSTSTNSSSICSIKAKVAIAIPLLHQVDCYSFRGYQLKSGAWSTLFKILENMERHDGQLFQDCITSISTLCRTLGLKWTEHTTYGQRMQLQAISTNHRRFAEAGNTSTIDSQSSVIIQLDCGSELLTSKQLLTDASPVFSAMFDGHFLEASQQNVRLSNTSREAMQLLLDELNCNKVAEADPVSARQQQAHSQSHPDIKTLFELLSLSNQYMLEEIQHRTLNTIISSCLCPYAAAEIYKHIVRQLYQKVGPSHIELEASDITHLVLKYLLVGPGLGPNLQYKGFKKIFDVIEPQIVLADLKSFFESFSNNVLSVPPPLRRNSLAKHKQLKFQ